ncbi:hypothetical protein ACL90Y_03885 [Micrococcus luteus]
MSGGFDLLGALSGRARPDESATTAGRPSPDDPSGTGALPCSARGCGADAAFGLRWNNPRIHSPERRKTWLACPEHRAHLSAFLSDRGFLKETVDVADLPGTDGQTARAPRPEGRTPTWRGGDAE